MWPHLALDAHVMCEDALGEVQLLDRHPQCTEVRLPVERLLRGRQEEGEVALFLNLAVLTSLAIDHPGQVLDHETAQEAHKNAWTHFSLWLPYEPLCRSSVALFSV